jgi:hypothetical protein
MLAPVDSEVRKRTCRALMRISETGHQRHELSYWLWRRWQHESTRINARQSRSMPAILVKS